MDALYEAVPAFQKLLDQAQTVKVITHVAPDGDALGSLLGLGLALQQLDKQVIFACDDSAPPKFAYMPAIDKLTFPEHGKTEQVDLIIAVDCGDAGRMGRSYSKMAANDIPIINIDHHRTNDNFGQLNIVVANASSTTEILSCLLPALNLTITQPVAVCLLTGLVTDTLSFRISTVNAGTLQVASDLIAKGANLYEITEQALLVKPLSTIHMYQQGLKNLQYEDGFVWVTISNAERLKAGYFAKSSAGLVSMLGNVAEAKIGCVMMEMDNGRVYIGFRCRTPWDVATLATKLGGGGHQQASGCSLGMSLAEAEKLVVTYAKAEIARQKTLFQAEL